MKFIFYLVSILNLLVIMTMSFYVCELDYYNKKLYGEISHNRVIIENQSSSTNIITQKYSDLINLNQEILDRANDLQVENQDLRKTIENNQELIDYLIEQIKSYKQKEGEEEIFIYNFS